MATTTNTASTNLSRQASWDSNSVQLNIVSFVDVMKAAANRSSVGATYMMDNNPNSLNRGTPNLQTVCKQGQVLNWIIYAMDMDRRPDGTWPPSVRINNIVFLDDAGVNVSIARVVDELKILGGPDKIRSPYTPVYYYWAGIVQNDLPPGVYRYRFVLELDLDNNKTVYVNMDGQSLKVEALDDGSVG